MDWRDHISIDRDVCHGEPCFVGTRVLVTVVLDNLAVGVKEEEILKSYPSIGPRAIRAALCYASELAKRRPAAMPP